MVLYFSQYVTQQGLRLPAILNCFATQAALLGVSSCFLFFTSLSFDSVFSRAPFSIRCSNLLCFFGIIALARKRSSSSSVGFAGGSKTVSSAAASASAASCTFVIRSTASLFLPSRKSECHTPLASALSSSVKLLKPLFPFFAPSAVVLVLPEVSPSPAAAEGASPVTSAANLSKISRCLGT